MRQNGYQDNGFSRATIIGSLDQRAYVSSSLCTLAVWENLYINKTLGTYE